MARNCIPPHDGKFCCMLPDVLKQFDKICQRTRSLALQRKRLAELAQPKHRVPMPSNYTCKCSLQQNQRIGPRVQIVQAHEPMHTRTEQLSYPRVRNLINLKKERNDMWNSPYREQTMNRLLRKSIYSVYSALSNVVPMSEPPPRVVKRKRKRFDPDPYIAKLAQPKHKPPSKEDCCDPSTFTESEKSHSSGSIDEMPPPILSPRLVRLAQSKPRSDWSPKPWMLTPNMRYFKPSQRLVKLARSKPIEVDPPDPFKVRSSALRFRATSRIEELAAPVLRRSIAKVDVNSLYAVSARALRAEATQRLVELATPRTFKDVHTRKNPFGVKKKAMRAMLTPRLEELSQPKYIRFVN